MFLLALIFSVVIGIIWYLNHKLTYWKRKGVPSPGLIYQWYYYRRELGPYDLELSNKLGPVYGVCEALKPILIVSHPDLIRDILVKDFTSFPNHKPFRVGSPIFDLNMFSLNGDEQWKRIRSLLSPTFTSGKLRNMENIVNDCIEVFKKNLTKVAKKNETIDMKKYSNSFTFDVLCRCAYGAHIESLNDPNSPLQKNFEKTFISRWDFIFTILFPKIANWTGIKDMSLKPMECFIQMTKALIEDRKKATKNLNNSTIGTGNVYNDFLQTMLDANAEAKKEAGDQQVNRKSITEEEMMAQSLIFLFAGFDTTATILGCTAYHLAKNPDIQDNLANEVSDLKEFTHDSVMNLKYLEAVLKECFRLSPPVIRVERECTQPTILGNVQVEPGTIVSIPVYAVHRDPKQYPNPEMFDPERFVNDDGNKYHPYAYMPFGGGPRMCVAQRLALLEVKLAFAQILKEFRFVAVPETNLTYSPAPFDLLAPKPIMVKIEKRS